MNTGSASRARASGSAPAASGDGALPFSTLVTYGLPAAGIGVMYYLAVLYLMVFSTDVLLVAPAAVATILGVSRVMDAVTDPLAGYLSDRTDSRLGRRRPWLLWSAVPLSCVFVMMWAPPPFLEGPPLTAWMAVAIIGFFGAITLVNVPHQSWGAELSPRYHERTRIFGMRLLMENVGAFVAIGVLFYVSAASDARVAMAGMVTTIAVAMAAATIFSALRLRERTELQGRGPKNVFGAVRDVAGNRHARLLLIVYFVESLGGATIGVLTPYMAAYVIVDVDFPPIVLTYLVAMTLSVPVWTPLSRIVGKKWLWFASMVGTAIGFGCFFLLGRGDVLETYVLAAVVGACAGCGNVIAPSVQSDIVDVDELETGERKEGGFFAAFGFVKKSAAGVTIMLTGIVLQFSGYLPNVEQSESATLAIRVLFSLFPLVCYVIGALMFLRFALGEAEHDVVRRTLEARRAAE